MHRSLLLVDQETCVHSKTNCFNMNTEGYSNLTVIEKTAEDYDIHICGLILFGTKGGCSLVPLPRLT